MTLVLKKYKSKRDSEEGKKGGADGKEGEVNVEVIGEKK